jgi:dihydroorotate dehydrogenase (NAD+) catalytic subunit
MITFGPPLEQVDLATTLCGVELPTPVLTASGCSNNGLELAPFLDLAGIGAVVTKSVMSKARSGRPTPRMAETPSGMLNSIGLQGPGIDRLLEHDIPALLDKGARAVVSIAGGSLQEYVDVARKVATVDGISLIEVNISCPNVESRGEVFACDPVLAAAVISAVKRVSVVPVLAKLSPDVTDIVEVAESVVTAGADGLSLINTLLGLVLDPETLLPVLGGLTGGLSGPAIRPVALRCVWQVHQAMPEVPILGMGGIRTGADALAFLAAGATAVSIGTATFGDPSSPQRVATELAAELAKRGLSSPSDAIGLAHRTSS